MADRAVSADARADAEIEWRYAMRKEIAIKLTAGGENIERLVGVIFT
jgi:hypothetical protein